MSDTDWWFLDLAVVVAATGAITFGVLVGVTGIPRLVLTIPLVLVFPGYAFVAVMFPDDTNDEYRPFDEEKTGLRNPLLVTGGLGPIERTIMSVVFSIALVPAIALLASVTPRGLTLEPVLLGISLLTVVLALLALVARTRCPPERRFAPSLSGASPFFARNRPGPFGTPNPRPYNLAIAIGLLLLVASAGFAVANPPQHDGFTEFSVDTEDVTGETETMYDSSYTVGETKTVNATITNQEHEERTYTTVVLLERVSVDGDELTVGEREELHRQNVTIPDGETRQLPLEVTPTMQGSDLRLTLLLYEGTAPSNPTGETADRSLHLPIEVE